MECFSFLVAADLLGSQDPRRLRSSCRFSLEWREHSEAWVIQQAGARGLAERAARMLCRVARWVVRRRRRGVTPRRGSLSDSAVVCRGYKRRKCLNSLDCLPNRPVGTRQSRGPVARARALYRSYKTSCKSCLPLHPLPRSFFKRLTIEEDIF